jgi:polyhydroxyalkanoate synthesis regulator phasin
MRKQLATVGLAATLVAGGAGALALVGPGLSLAQETVQDEATTAAEAPERGERLSDALQPLVDDGTLTAEQRDAVVATLAEAMPRGGHGGPGRHGGPALDAAADVLGMSEDDLRTAVRDGQSLADVAAATGVDVQTVIDGLVTRAQEHLAEEVAEGDLTQEEADERLATVTERVTAMVNGERSEGAPEGGFRERMHERFGSDTTS